MLLSEHVNTRATVVLGRKWAWMAFTGAVCIVLGLAAIATPLVTSVSVSFGVGAILIVSGIIHLIQAIRLKNDHGNWARFAQSILMMLVGALILNNPIGGMLGLTVALSFYFFSSAIVSWNLAGMMPRDMQFWGRLNALTSFILGVFIVATLPLSAFWVPGTFLGIDLFFAGIYLIGFAITTRDLQRKFEGRRDHLRGVPTSAHPA